MVTLNYCPILLKNSLLFLHCASIIYSKGLKFELFVHLHIKSLWYFLNSKCNNCQFETYSFSLLLSI